MYGTQNGISIACIQFVHHENVMLSLIRPDRSDDNIIIIIIAFAVSRNAQQYLCHDFMSTQ